MFTSRNNVVQEASRSMRLFISSQRLARICNMAGVNPRKAADFIDGGPDGWTDTTDADQQKWIDNASDKEVADWIAAGQ